MEGRDGEVAGDCDHHQHHPREPGHEGPGPPPAQLRVLQPVSPGDRDIPAHRGGALR